MTRLVLITGGTRGIGAGIAKKFKKHGYTVIVTYGGHDDTAKKFTEETGIPAYKWDVGNYKACEEGIAMILQNHGPIDILVNNAGITRDGFLHKMTDTMWNDVIQTNLTSCFNMCRVVIELMREHQFGRIINISSINAQKGQKGQTNYCAAKAGIIGFTKALAQESAPKGITVNAIAPGYIDTDMVRAVPENILESIIGEIPAKRLGTVEEVGRVALFLADEKSGFINGATLSMNGGQYMM